MNTPERQSSYPRLSRFEIVRRLGEGGMGVVYEALDRQQGGHVALKTLHRFDAETLLYLKQEFRALQDIQHPNLVRLGELMREGETWYFTMELVTGTDLFGYLGATTERRDRSEDVTLPRAPALVGADASSSGIGGARREREVLGPSSSGERAVSRPEAVDEAKLRSAFAELADGLGALHAAGKVHRDVKPSNVLVTREGRVVLVDFGLVLDSAAPEQDHAIVGTAKYMAPEQAASQSISAAADWYSFGVVLYQCLTGRFPFDGDAMRVIEKKLTEDAPRASLTAPHVPRDLDELCARLLEREPKKRPLAQEVAHRLRGGQAAKARRPSPRAPFIGREGELAALSRALEAVRGGETKAVVVLGESGMGKSALARRFLREAAKGPGTLVLSGRCYEREVVPYKALDGVMDALCQHLAPLEDDDVVGLFPENAALLTQAFPVLRRLARFEVAARQRRSRADLLAYESRGRFFDTVRELFEKLGNAHTLVVFVDDLHWADADSLSLLAELFRPPSPPRMLFLATARPGAEAKTPFAAETIPLARLDDEHTLSLARALLGAGRAGAASAIAGEAQGHPLFVDELVRHALEMGEDAPAGSSLDEALAVRVARAPAPARALLEVLAVAGVAVGRKTATRASGLDPDAFAHASAVLRAAHLARPAHARGDEHALEPYHDRVREAVAVRLSEPDRRARHLALALALEEGERHDADALATHFVEAGERARAAPYAREAAHKAFEALAYDRAASLYARAIDLGAVSPDEKARLEVRLGEALASAGRGGEAAAAFLRAAEARSGEQALELRRRSAEELLISGQLDAGMAALRDVLARIGVGMPRSAFMTVVSMMLLRAWLAVRGLGARLHSEEELPKEVVLRMDACWTVARALAFIDPLQSAYFQTRLLLMALRSGERFRLAYSLGMEGGWRATRGHHTRARADEAFARAAEVAGHCERPELAALLRAARGFAALMQGRPAEAVAESGAALAMLRERAPHEVWEIRSTANVVIWALCATGELEELSVRAEPALREAEDRGDVMTTTVLRTGNLVWLRLREDDPAGGRAAAQAALAQWTRGGYHHQHWWGTVALALADLYEEKGRDAWEKIARDAPRARRAMLFTVELVHFDFRHLHARTAIAAAASAPPGSDERRRFLRDAQADIRWMARRGPPYSPPWVSHLEACIAALHGKHDVAARGLAEAARGFDDFGVPIWAASAKWQLAKLTKGDEAATLRQAARVFWEANRVEDPDRMAAVFAPGFARTEADRGHRT